jgi:putative oxidoreductase
MFNVYDKLTARLLASGDYLWPLAIRLVMFWEFWTAGLKKLNGDNWFETIPWADWQKGFPWPFSAIPTELNWMAATWGELVFSSLLLFGLFTRFAALSLLVITAVAAAAVHWPAEWISYAQLWEGYLITSDGGGNFRLPLIFMALLLPLVFYGGGKLSLDTLLLKFTGRDGAARDRIGDGIAAGLMFAILGVATIFLEPSWGITFLVLAVIASLANVFRR